MVDFFKKGTTNQEVCSTLSFSDAVPSEAHPPLQMTTDLNAPNGYFGVASPTLDSAGRFETETPDGVKMLISP
jgi:hypothetical protein